jgi:hypothetical protein
VEQLKEDKELLVCAVVAAGSRQVHRSGTGAVPSPVPFTPAWRRRIEVATRAALSGRDLNELYDDGGAGAGDDEALAEGEGALRTGVPSEEEV